MLGKGKAPGANVRMQELFGRCVWRCRVTLRHRDNVDRWGWGVAFD
jgi:hypothetical protein